MKNINRRDFLKIAGQSSIALGLPVSFMSSPFAANGNFTDFKALVVVQLNGGNDSLNTFVPADTSASSTKGYEQYKKIRTDEVRIKDNDMMSALRAKRSGDFLNLSSGTGNFYTPSGGSQSDLKAIYTKGFYRHNLHFGGKIATNGLMPELANILDLGNGAVVQNVGNIKKIYTKAQLQADRSLYPPFIGAHNQQHVLTETGQASSITHPTGWLGRLADKWAGNANSSLYGLNISLSPFGRKQMLYGNNTSGFNFSSRGPVAMNDVNKDAYKDIASVNRGDMFGKLFNDARQLQYNNIDSVITDWNSVTGNNDPFAGVKDSYGLDLFAIPELDVHNLSVGINSRVIDNFAAAARLIKIAKDKGEKRVVITISTGGWDTHSTQSRQHITRYRGLSLGLDKFTRAMKHLGIYDDVTTFNISEFGRTAVSNGSGTDHGWGGSYFVLGGSVKKGNYGTFADMRPEGPDDDSKRARFIPTTSFTQYYATLLKWFGASDDELKHALPELENFTEKDLKFMV